jgi:hypothetical protein
MSQQPAGCAAWVLLLLLGVRWVLLPLLVGVEGAANSLRAVATATHSTFVY